MGTQREEFIVRAGFDNTALASGLRTAQTSVKRFATEVGRTVLAAFSAGAIIAQIDSIFNRVKAIQAGAAKTGLNVVDYQNLSKIANEELPDGAEKFDQALTKLNVKIGEGAKELEKWGIHSKNAEDAMYEIADRMKAMDDPAERAAMAVDLMGRGGASMVPLLERGAAAMKEMANSKFGWSAQDMKNIEDAHKNLEESKNWITTIIGKGAGAIMTGANLLGGLSSGESGTFMAGPSSREIASIRANRREEQVHAEFRKDALDQSVEASSELYENEMDLLDASIADQEASEKKAKAEKETLEIQKQSIALHREAAKVHKEMADIDKESPTIADLAGRKFTNRLNRLYGQGGRFDLGAGNGPYAKAAQQYELAQKQQVWDLTHGNIAAANRDRMRQIAAHNLLAGAGLETPAMKMTDMVDHLNEIKDGIAVLAKKAATDGLNVKITGVDDP